MPTHTPTADSILAIKHREGLLETQHHGSLIVTNNQQDIIYQTPGSEKAFTFLRSTAKPAQAFPLIEEGLHQDLTEEEIAVICGSHAGTPRHTAIVRNILKKANLDEEALQCGTHSPLCKESAHKLIQKNQKPQKAHNNCSGKHSGMLLYCVRKGLSIKNYTAQNHPLQQAITGTIQQWSKLPEEPKLGYDGCGAPCHYIPLHAAAKLFSHLATAEEARPITKAMTSHPELIGNTGRIDTSIIEASQGKLLAKVGADGVLGVSHLQKGLGLFLKVNDGNQVIRDHLIVIALKKIRWLDANALTYPALQRFLDADIKTLHGHRCGQIETQLPHP